MFSRISTYLYLRPKLVLALLLVPPLVWMLVVYLGSLADMLVNSFFYLDEFTGQMVRQFTLQTYAQLFEPAVQVADVRHRIHDLLAIER